jgi:hypothetical protein
VMYEVDEKDRVAPLRGVPPSSVGAHIPLLFADEGRIVLAYYSAPTRAWTGTPIMVDQFTQ